MIYLAIPGVVVAALGALIAAVAVFVATMQDAGKRAASPRKGTHRAIARAELARLWERLATFELPAPSVPVPAPRRHVNGVNRGTQPRLTPYPTAADPVTPLATDDAPPWDITTTQQPALDEPAYGVDRCEADVDEAGRHFALAMGPDGCEETS